MGDLDMRQIAILVAPLGSFSGGIRWQAAKALREAADRNDALATEVEQLRSAISALHRVWFTGADVDKTAVTHACLSLFVTAEQCRPVVGSAHD